MASSDAEDLPPLPARQLAAVDPLLPMLDEVARMIATNDDDAAAIAALKARYLDPRHYPNRTCLGCGGTGPESSLGIRWSLSCEPSGVRAELWSVINSHATRLRSIRLTWRQLAAADGTGAVQECLGL